MEQNILPPAVEATDHGAALAGLDQRHFGAAPLARFQAYLAEAGPIELSMIRVEDLAPVLGLDEARTLELLVAAVQAGALDLRWEVLCPECTGATESWSSLRDGHHTSFCAYCSKNFGVRLDLDVRVRFSRHPRYGEVRLPRPSFQIHQADESHVTGLDLLNFQVFRDLLQEQVLIGHESLGVTRVAILFTDLRGSTALYASKGDPAAYALVSEHFDVLFAVTREAGGAVIKTIGDSIMAAFAHPAAAVRAGIAMQAGIAAFNRRHTLPADEALVLRVGIHAGPCITVQMNGIMDYFGSAANIAARIEALAQGNDLLFTGEIRADPAVPALIAVQEARGGHLVSFVAPMRGLPAPMLVHRLVLPESLSEEHP